MDSRELALFETEVRRQIGFLERLHEAALARAARMSGDLGLVESAAFQVNNYYSAVEELLSLVAVAFENNIKDATRWHTELIDRMALAFPGVRPALLSAGTADRLQRLRAFRHFFRHAYRVELDEGEVRQNVNRVQEIHPRLLADVERFLEALSAG